MAKFLQDTVEEMAVTAKQKKTQEVVAEFANFFEKVIKCHGYNNSVQGTFKLQEIFATSNVQMFCNFFFEIPRITIISRRYICRKFNCQVEDVP